MGASACPTAELGISRTLTIPGFSFKEFTQPPRRHLPWHDHRDASICFVAAGSYAERMDGRAWQCEAEAMVFKPPFEGHADQMGPQGSTCLLIEIAPRRVEALTPFTDITVRPSVLRTGTLMALGRRIHREFSRPDPWSALTLEALVLESLATASRTVTGFRGRGAPVWLQRACELIHDTLSTDLSLSAIAGAVDIHPSHLARTFRIHFRRSIGEYVRELRVASAGRELAETDRPLAEIAVRAGFFDQSHFSKVFRRQTGQSPAEFRRSAGQRTARTDPHRAS